MRDGLGSGCLDDAASSDAGGADAGLFVDAINNRLYAAKIRVPPAPRDVVCVADRVAKTRLLAANFTCHCHRRSDSNIFENGQILMLAENPFTGKRFTTLFVGVARI
jgi:hypothetical protein